MELEPAYERAIRGEEGGGGGDGGGDGGGGGGGGEGALRSSVVVAMTFELCSSRRAEMVSFGLASSGTEGTYSDDVTTPGGAGSSAAAAAKL